MRWPPYHEAVRGSAAPAYVFVAASRTDEALTDLLSSRGITVERREKGAFAVLLPATRVLPEEVAPALQG